MRVALTGLAQANFAKIKDWHLELDLHAAASAARPSCFALSPGNACHVQQVDEPRRVGEAVGLCESIDFDTRDLQIDAPADGVHLNGRQAHRPLRHGGQHLRQFEFNLVAPQPQ